jgi:hypothetical protein
MIYHKLNSAVWCVAFRLLGANNNTRFGAVWQGGNFVFFSLN